MTSFLPRLFSSRNLLLALCLYWLWPKNFLAVPADGLDWSWMLDLNWAFHQGYVFGRDWIFTYGPLGWLVTRTDFLLPKLPLLLFDVALMAACGRVLYTVLGRVLHAGHPLGVAGVLFAVFMLASVFDPLIELLVLLLFCLFEHHRTGRAGWLWAAVGISVLGFFIKFNMAFVYSLLLWLYVAYCLFIERKHLGFGQAAGLLAVQAAGLVGLSVWLHVDLPGYVRGGLEIISGYNDAMNVYNTFLEQNTYNALPPLLLGIALAGLVWGGGVLLLGFFRKTRFDGFVWVSVSLAFYVIFKHAFTYYGQGPANEIFAATPALLGLGLLYVQHPKTALYWGRGWAAAAALCVLGIGTLHAWLRAPQHFPYVDVLLHSPVARQAARPDVSHRRLDSATVARIGQRTVDVFPENIDFALYSGLNHRPRPAVQAYIAGHSPHLLQLDYDFVLSEKAPDFVLYQTRRLENPLHESPSRLAFRRRYAVVDTAFSHGGDTLLVLEKTRIKPLKEQVLQEVSVPLGQWVRPGTLAGRMNWVSMAVHYNLWGKIRRFFFQPPKLWLEARYADGTTGRWPVVIHTLGAGMPLERLEQFAEMNRWLKGQPGNVPIRALRLLPAAAGFAPEASYIFKSYL